MVKLIDAGNRERWGAVIEQMHRDRKKVFVDWLKWDVPVEGDLEIDQYDTDDAVYLVSLDPDTGEHVASIRLLPCSVPTLMAEHFADMVQNPVPSDDTAWEMTRLCASPAVKDKLKAWNARKEITVAAVEFALARGIEQLIFVTHTSWVPTILSVGWDIELLGLPRRDGNETISAMRIHVTPATLDLLRGNWGVTGSMLEMDEDRIAAAA
jgi:N-acyl-L-homoserine lactone synthetase